MHKSQLSSIVIDCNANDLDEAAGFWSAALGWQGKPLPNEDDANYRELTGPDDEIKSWSSASTTRVARTSTSRRTISRPRCGGSKRWARGASSSYGAGG
jgi:hypothetical protein